MSNNYEAVGKLHAVMPTQQVKDTFRKREFVLEIVDGQYPQHIKFQLTQNNCDRIDQYSVGQEIKVHFNLRGRPFQGKDGTTMYFTNLEAWRLESVQAGGLGTTGQDYSQIAPAQPAATNTDFDDVPF
jgi:hypothetical protein